MNISLVYMAAGLSSRFGGKIKQLARVGKNNETFIECSIQQAIKCTNNKISQIVFIVGEKTESDFKKLFKNKYYKIPIKYVKQKYNQEKRDRPWGTADAVVTIKNVINGPCIICNSDDLYGESSFKTLLEHLEKNKDDAVIALPLKKVLPENGEVTRGVFKTENGYLTEAREVFNISRSNFKEKGLTENDLCNINLFLLYKKTINLLSDRVKSFKIKNKEDRKIECFIHIELAQLTKEGKIRIKVYKSEEPWLGITNPGDEEIVRKILRKMN